MPLFTGPVAVTTMATFLESLQGFLTTGGAGNPGWTDENAGGGTYLGVDTTNGEWAVSKSAGGTNYIQVAGQWATGSPQFLGLYQYYNTGGPGSYVDGSRPWGQSNDSGNGYSGGTITNANLDDERYVLIGNSPIRYWCFTGDTYAHVVVETSSGVYVHFGFGLLDKFNDWTGGEYCYGHRVVSGQYMSSADSSFLLDGFLNGTGRQDYAATIRIQGMSDSPASGRWGVSMVDGQGSGSLGLDSAGVGRVHIIGGVRAGPHAYAFGNQPGSYATGLIPSGPIVVYHIDRNISGSSSTYVNAWTPLGAMKDVRTMDIRNFEPGDTITIGSDTWYVFPLATKYRSGSVNSTSGHAGVMYKANT